jgi:hypothetical protein
MVTQSNDSNLHDSNLHAVVSRLGRLITGLWLGAQGGWLFGYMFALPRPWMVAAGVLAGGLTFITLEGE